MNYRCYLVLLFCLSALPLSHYLQARVRLGRELGSDEQLFLVNRIPLVRQALEKLLKIPVPVVPKIAFCFSGGGYRAELASFGTLAAAEKSGILDATSYLIGLSGSAWTLIMLYLNGVSTLAAYEPIKKQVSGRLGLGFSFAPLIKRARERISFQQYLNPVGLYGGLIASRMFEGNADRYDFVYSNLAPLVITGKYPLPIITSVAILPQHRHEWVEFTPFEIGLIEQNAYISTHLFGRQFVNGNPINNAPEYPLDLLIGIWGSAHTGSCKEAVDRLIRPTAKNIASFFDKTLPETISSTRIFPARVHNFTYQLNGLPLASNPFITMVDAGVAFNMPLPPVLKKERGVDIIIIGDSSTRVTDAPALKKAEEYAQQYNLPFPRIDYQDIEKKSMSVFKEKGKPTIIYLPLIANPRYSRTFNPRNLLGPTGYCSTINFLYTPQQFTELFGLTAFTFFEETARIIDVIKEWVEEHVS